MNNEFAKIFSFWGTKSPRPPTMGSAPGIPLGLRPKPHYRLDNARHWVPTRFGLINALASGSSKILHSFNFSSSLRQKFLNPPLVGHRLFQLYNLLIEF